MIITQHAANPHYGTDQVAASLRSFVAAPAVRFATSPEHTIPAGNLSLDLRALYPALFAAEPQTRIAIRPVRAAAFRLSLAATVVAIVALLHG